MAAITVRAISSNYPARLAYLGTASWRSWPNTTGSYIMGALLPSQGHACYYILLHRVQVKLSGVEERFNSKI